MSHRHVSRSLCMQTLFVWDFNGYQSEHISDILDYVIREFGAGIDDETFIRETVSGVVSKRVILDEIIQKAAPEWPLEKIGYVDRNVLRLGLYELLFGDREHIPPKVALNEAIELGKNFGGENTGRFINGVLGAVYKEMGEPGKEQVSKKKKFDNTVDLNDIPVEEKGGAVIFSRDESGTVRFAMVHDVFGYWTLSKGGIDLGETVEDGTIRSIQEEIALPITIIEKLGENEYIAHHPEKGKIRKHVHYFLCEGPYQDLVLSKGTGGLDQAKWFELADISELMMYDDVTKLIAGAIAKLTVSVPAAG
jgi:N utilization substance protein B